MIREIAGAMSQGPRAVTPPPTRQHNISHRDTLQLPRPTHCPETKGCTCHKLVARPFCVDRIRQLYTAVVRRGGHSEGNRFLVACMEPLPTGQFLYRAPLVLAPEQTLGSQCPIETFDLCVGTFSQLFGCGKKRLKNLHKLSRHNVQLDVANPCEELFYDARQFTARLKRFQQNKMENDVVDCRACLAARKQHFCRRQKLMDCEERANQIERVLIYRDERERPFEDFLSDFENMLQLRSDANDGKPWETRKAVECLLKKTRLCPYLRLPRLALQLRNNRRAVTLEQAIAGLRKAVQDTHPVAPPVQRSRHAAVVEQHNKRIEEQLRKLAEEWESGLAGPEREWEINEQVNELFGWHLFDD